ncbi:pheromone-binding protein Gp-9-like [Pseudomyrmex gracilis]|uniref:pheromone-binding protein Gp-9-like n=1 Tax=Pseudomyrmex gracilis TaxID=219809 RepID=UPI000994B6A2|nr:pheromone-binding protein Gp-9-like [Pseudomyrmex gracilis]
MQRAIIFVLSLFVAVTIGVEDDFVEGIAQALVLERSDVETCMNKTNVQLEDLENVDKLLISNLQTDEIDESALKVGCLFACLAQKKEIMSGARINNDKIKKILDAKMPPNLDPEIIADRDHILDLCADRVKSKINECEVAFRYMICFGSNFTA